MSIENIKQLASSATGCDREASEIFNFINEQHGIDLKFESGEHKDAALIRFMAAIAVITSKDEKPESNYIADMYNFNDENITKFKGQLKWLLDRGGLKGVSASHKNIRGYQYELTLSNANRDIVGVYTAEFVFDCINYKDIMGDLVEQTLNEFNVK